MRDESEVIMVVGWMVGGDGGWFWALVIFLEAGGWVVGLRSLLGWLWWRWILRLGGEAEIWATPALTIYAFDKIYGSYIIYNSGMSFMIYGDGEGSSSTTRGSHLRTWASTRWGRWKRSTAVAAARRDVGCLS